MNIRQKLTVASILMIVIPIAVSLLLSIVILFSKGSSTLNRLKNLYENDNGLLNVQTILYNYKEQILSYEPLDEASFLDDDDFDDDDDDDDDFEEELEERRERIEKYNEIRKERQEKAFSDLIGELTSLGYYYEISYEDKVEVTNLPDDVDEKMIDLAGSDYKKISTFAVTDEQSSAVKRTYYDSDTKVAVLAYCDHSLQSGSQISQVIRDIFSIAGVFAAILLIAIIFSIFILTRWLAGGMKNSLEQLSEAVKQVRDGNLSYRIHSKRKDELGRACEEFDEMADYLERSVEERKMYEKARKQMLAGISHDLRTPLTSIKAYVEGLRDGIANTEEKKQRYYKALMTRTGDLEALIDNLSLFSRFDRGEYHYTMETIELGKFLDDFLKENEIEFYKNNVKIQKTAWPREGIYIEGDKKQLKRVLGNIVDNAIKYRDKEATKLSVGLWKYKEKIWIEIMDDGPGVPAEERDRIFETFYRGDEARQNPGNGSGLGLAIVKEILKGHGARIQAEQGDGERGLRLIIEFPEKNEAKGR